MAKLSSGGQVSCRVTVTWHLPQSSELAKTTEIDSLRFSDKDLDLVGTLEYGQFGVVRFYLNSIATKDVS